MDLLKGFAIILVVAQHALDFLEAMDWQFTPLMLALAAIGTVRIPAFFFAAALFFSANFARPWRFVLVQKVLPMLYIFVLWSLIRSLYLVVGPWALQPSIDPLQFALTAFVDPRSSMWFVYALAIYFVIARLTAALPFYIGWVVAVVPSTLFLSGFIATGNWAWDSVVKAYVFFYAGTQLRSLLYHLERRLRIWQVIPLWIVWLGLIGVSYLTYHALTSPLLPVISITGLLATVMSCMLVDRFRYVDWIRRIGRQTFPVYLLHVYALALLTPIVVQFFSATPTGIVSAFVAMTAISIGASYAVWFLLRRIPGLFSAPWVGRTT